MPSMRTGKGSPSIVIRSSRQPLASSEGMLVGGPTDSSEMAAGRTTGSPKRRSIVVRGSMAVISITTGPAGRGAGSGMRLCPLPSGGGTATSTGGPPAVNRSPVMGDVSPPVRCVIVSSVLGASSVACRRAPTACPKGVIHAVAGSPSVADHPAAPAAPESRALAWAPSMPSSSASTASSAR